MLAQKMQLATSVCVRAIVVVSSVLIGGVVAIAGGQQVEVSVAVDVTRLVAELKRMGRAAFREHYQNGFMGAFRHLASRGRNANVLQHAAGHLKKRLDSASRSELAALIHDYRKGLVPLVAPLTLMGHHVRCHDVDYLKGQVFLEPHPKELMLRNHV